MKKQLKFRDNLVPKILSGEKRSTWRLFDDKDLQVGDELEFLNWRTKEKFGEATILAMKETVLGALTPEEMRPHYRTFEEMFEHYGKYYGPEVGSNTPLKIIAFDFRQVLSPEEETKVRKLKMEGFGPVYVWDAEPREIDEEHTHDFDTKLAVLNGEIKLKIASDIIRDYKLKSGDSLEIPRKQIHSAVVGPEGCKYIVAERH